MAAVFPKQPVLLLDKIEAVASTRARSGLCLPGFIFLSSFESPFILETTPVCYYAMALFPKRLTCHGCGHRSPQPVRGSVGKFHCSNCDADTYLDQVRSRALKDKAPLKLLTCKIFTEWRSYRSASSGDKSSRRLESASRPSRFNSTRVRSLLFPMSSQPAPAYDISCELLRGIR
jgi:hypothetical protein